VSRVVAFIIINIDMITLFACLVGWFLFFTCRNSKEIKAQMLKYGLSRVKTGNPACARDCGLLH